METLAQYLKRILAQKDLKAADVAELSGLSAGYIGRLLSGEKTNLTVETISVLVESLELDALELFTAAYGKPVSVREGTDPHLLIDTFDKLVTNPGLIELVQDLLRLPVKQQEAILETIRLMGHRSQKVRKRKR